MRQPRRVSLATSPSHFTLAQVATGRTEPHSSVSTPTTVCSQLQKSSLLPDHRASGPPQAPQWYSTLKNSLQSWARLIKRSDADWAKFVRRDTDKNNRRLISVKRSHKHRAIVQTTPIFSKETRILVMYVVTRKALTSRSGYISSKPLC